MKEKFLFCGFFSVLLSTYYLIREDFESSDVETSG
ncbi:hypothetical protein Fsol_00296 [Candidatus Fokinia solitaria]|uniref:Uncharacterized protein n=1 Tax=Candidatus Fokinia solitaria TaxID=1802984 RepID=A0A2U8BS13_9RICK|nr:hypothetical protein Fsol_00296 [Candidatus Fokinia solitaria]